MSGNGVDRPSRMPSAKHVPWRRVPPVVWALGFGSLFMDASSELIHSVLPIFMVTTLGASMSTVGLIEGVAEATAAIMKVFSGAFSDRVGSRKWPLLLGYGLSACTKPIFPLAGSVASVFAARFVDRLGKGVRGAPRDALVADSTSPDVRGAAYGLRQSLDSVGALIGPGMAVALMFWFAEDVRAVMWVAVIPAGIAVTVLLVYVREPDRPHTGGTPVRVTLLAVTKLPSRYWLVVGLGAAVTLARFSEAFLVLRAQDVGLDIRCVPVVMMVMNVAYAGAAYPAGAASDRVHPRTMLTLGLIPLIAADLLLAVASAPLVVFAGAALWGLHMGLSQGLLSKLVADTVPAGLVGTGFGIFNVLTGGALLLASLIAGGLWTAFGPSATFLAGALFATAAGLGVVSSARHSSALAR